jgi:hypothetical protein
LRGNWFKTAFKKIKYENGESSSGGIRLLRSGYDIVDCDDNISPINHKLFAGSVSEQHCGKLLHQHPGVLCAGGHGQRLH